MRRLDRDSVLFGAAGWLPSAIVAIWSLYAFSDPYPDLWMVVSYLALAVALITWWILRFIYAKATRHQGPSGVYWAIEPLMLVTAFGILVSGVAFLLRFDLGERELNAYVTNPAARSSKSVNTVGTFRILETDIQRRGVVRMITEDAGMVDKGGIVHSPSGTPADFGEDVYEHIRGPWWKWYQSW